MARCPRLTRTSTFLQLRTDCWLLLQIFSPIIKFWDQWWQSWRGLLSWNPIPVSRAREKLHCLCHSGLGRSEPRMSSRNVILMWTWTMRKSILQNLSLMTGVSQSSSSSLLTQETHPVLVLTMIQDSDNYFAVNISQPCIWWPESAWATRDLGSYKLTDPWLNIWIQTHDTLYCRDKNIQTTRQEASPGHSLMRLTLNRKHDNIYIQKPFVFWPFCHIKRYVSPSQQQVRDRNTRYFNSAETFKVYPKSLFIGTLAGSAGGSVIMHTYVYLTLWISQVRGTETVQNKVQNSWMVTGRLLSYSCSEAQTHCNASATFKMKVLIKSRESW